MTRRFTRRTMLVATLTAVGLLAAAGIAYAVIPSSSGEYTACMLKNVGTIRLIDPSLGSSALMGHCTSLETQISWNKQGTPGTNGVSPTVAQLAAGDSNCPSGGAAITDAANNTAYVCNGENGTDGEDFAGTFTSPNGQYRINVDDLGITLEGPQGKITLAGTTTEIRSDVDLKLRAGAAARLEAVGVLTLQGAARIQLNGCGAQVARLGDAVMGFTPVAIGPDGGGGSFPLQNGMIVEGSPTVCSG